MRWVKISLRGWRRWSLWLLLVALVAVLLVTLVWLAGRYEADQVQTKIERDAADAVGDIRAAFTHNIQSLQALHASEPTPAVWAQVPIWCCNSTANWCGWSGATALGRAPVCWPGPTRRFAHPCLSAWAARTHCPTWPKPATRRGA